MDSASAGSPIPAQESSTPRLQPERALPRGRLFFYFLTTFNICAVLAGLYLTQQVMGRYRQSLVVNQAWNVRLGEYSELGKLAGAVNAPGNDVFDSHDVAGESRQMREAALQFNQRLTALRAALKTTVSAGEAAPLRAKMDDLQAGMTGMIGEAEHIFADFTRGQPAKAGARMATMDRKYAAVNAALSDLRAAVGVIQDGRFEEQMAAAASLEKFEYALVILLCLMVFGAVIHGSHLAAQTAGRDGTEQRSGRRFPRWCLSLALGLCLLAGFSRFWLGPNGECLPADYASETRFTARNRSRQSATSAWETAELIGRRVDQTLVTSGNTSIIQGDLHWSTASGQALFESAGIYGVDRRTLRNLPGYGNVNRNGQFLFPMHIGRTTYRYWNPLYIGGCVATFDRTDTVDGLPVYVFRFTARGLDETAGYSHLPDVPERYQAHTDGQGTLWIEPTSGIVVDYEENGVSYFVAPATGRRVADCSQWSDRYTPETKAAHLQQAWAARRRSRALEVWLPGALLLGGLAALACGSWAVPRRRRPEGRTGAEQSGRNQALAGASQ